MEAENISLLGPGSATLTLNRMTSKNLYSQKSHPVRLMPVQEPKLAECHLKIVCDGL